MDKQHEANQKILAADKKLSKEEQAIIIAIAKRADKRGLMDYDRLSMIMDLTLAHNHYNLRLEELLDADDEDFAHDIIGIQRNIDRQKMAFDGVFCPRYSVHDTARNNAKVVDDRG